MRLHFVGWIFITVILMEFLGKFSIVEAYRICAFKAVLIPVLDFSIDGWMNLFMNVKSYLFIAIIVLFLIVVIVRKRIHVVGTFISWVILSIVYLYTYSSILIAPLFGTTYAVSSNNFYPVRNYAPCPVYKMTKTVVQLNSVLERKQVVIFFFLLHLFTLLGIWRVYKFKKQNYMLIPENTSF